MKKLQLAVGLGLCLCLGLGLGLGVGPASAAKVSGVEFHKKSMVACKGARAKAERAARDFCSNRGGLVQMRGGTRCEFQFYPRTPRRDEVVRSTVTADVRCRRGR